MNKKILSCLIVVIGLAAVFFGYQSFYSTSAELTYLDEQHGFVLQYPSVLNNGYKLHVGAFLVSDSDLLDGIYEQCEKYPLSENNDWPKKEIFANGQRFCLETAKDGSYYNYVTKVTQGRNVYSVTISGEGSPIEPMIKSFKVLPPPTAWQTYKNEQYGFELKLPEHFKTYQIKQESLSDGSERLAFYATTTDHKWSDNDLPNGHATLFSLSVMPVAKWLDIHNKCVVAIAAGEGDPSCGLFQSVLLKNDQWVIYNSSVRQAAPDDLSIFPFLLSNEYLQAHVGGTNQSAFDGKNSTFTIDGQPVTLVNGTDSTNTTKYFGNEAEGDLNGDGLEDVAFLITQSPGGSGTFYYVVVALQTADGYQTTNAFLIGDRIAPQSTEIQADAKELHVNFAERKAGEPMTTQPSSGAVLLLKVTPAGVLEGLMK